ncbi:hypothetical protein BDZ89DRAFT_1076944 [Hymenopellis radicata]|nr:hypothetical protein BDZ89DRAFT_1076944 [Hymenopellis radicata]
MTLAFQQALWPPENAQWNNQTKAGDVERFLSYRMGTTNALAQTDSKISVHVPISSFFLFRLRFGDRQPTSFFTPPA